MTATTVAKAIHYPSGDGKPVAESYAHVYAIFVTLEILRQYLAGQQATVLANQFLYYAQAFPKLRVAPDVMVIFGVAPGGRDSYKIWEEGQVPAVIFEMTSAQTRQKDQQQKKQIYEAIGVQEYWLFDPKGEWLHPPLLGYQLVGNRYSAISDNTSQVLQLRLVPNGPLIDFYRLDNGEKLLTPEELAQAREQERLEKERERQLRLELIEKLRARGIDPDAL
ncbi:MAG: Uma2 family endonuclease [Gloeomargarita sp. SKYBB_i_bin120]|nr:Uma2 family endonuclease [Gloeomargarita sp. SKYB120]MDW8178911.1 Uma2 family endonuclease [Gloeomargarita sp. SKYBB_i_bin120]